MAIPTWRLAIGAVWFLASAPGAIAQAVSQTAPGLLFQAEGQNLTAACNGQPALLEGNHDTLTLTGSCASLVVKGVGNDVHLALRPGGTVRVEGSGNHVTAAGANLAAPIVLGPDNAVTLAAAAPASPAPAVPLPPPAVKPVTPAAAKPATGPLLLDGADQDRLAECAGREVTITGLRSAYVLHGGCRSLVVRGDLLTVTAELAPGAHVLVVGRGDVVSYANRGRAPEAAIRGEGSRIQRAE